MCVKIHFVKQEQYKNQDLYCYLGDGDGPFRLTKIRQLSVKSNRIVQFLLLFLKNLCKPDFFGREIVDSLRLV